MADGLSAREVEVLRLIADGKTNRDIGHALFISLNTVATHVRKHHAIGIATLRSEP